MPSSDHTPRGWAARYTMECYDGMRDDRDRTAAYREAIAAAASGKVVLDIGTGALALLAVFAAQAGAKHVYAIEVQPAAAEAARETIAANGLSDRVTVLEGFSTDERVVLPVKAELIIHERELLATLQAPDGSRVRASHPVPALALNLALQSSARSRARRASWRPWPMP